MQCGVHDGAKNADGPQGHRIISAEAGGLSISLFPTGPDPQDMDLDR